MNRRKIGVFVHNNKGLYSIIKSNLPDYKVTEIHAKSKYEDSAEMLATLDSNEILVAEASNVFLTQNIHQLKNVKWIQFTFAGTDKFVNQLDHSKPPPSLTITRFSSHFGAHLSEYVISSIINFERNNYLFYDQQKEKVWRKNRNYRLLQTLSISILGCGVIGMEVARHCKQFGMKVYGMVTKLPISKNENVDEFFLLSDLPEYLKKSDFVCNILPNTPKTTDILSGDMLENCKEIQSTFINVGRGSVINDESLIKAIEKKWIKGAVLDVFNKEPLPGENKLWEYPNIIITPHNAGLSFDNQIFECFKENLFLYENGGKMNYIFDWDKKY